MIRINITMWKIVTSYQTASMSTVTTPFVCNEPAVVAVEIKRTILSVDQIQVLSGLVYAMYCTEYDCTQVTLGFVANANVITSADLTETFTWEGDVITHVWTDIDEVDPETSTTVFTVSSDEDHIILKSNGKFPMTVTLKNGMLESIDGEPAIKIGTSNESSTRVWFHHNKCFNEAHPLQPSSICGNSYIHHDEMGAVYRPAAEGPARYYIENEQQAARKQRLTTSR